MKYPMKYCISGCKEGDDGGAFNIPFNSRHLHVIASHGGGWEHVSVSLNNRCPTWDEMCFIKDLFFNDEDYVVQYHPAKSNYVNIHKYVLHLWKPIGIKIPTPPITYV